MRFFFQYFSVIFMMVWIAEASLREENMIITLKLEWAEALTFREGFWQERPVLSSSWFVGKVEWLFHKTS